MPNEPKQTHAVRGPHLRVSAPRTIERSKIKSWLARLRARQNQQFGQISWKLAPGFSGVRSDPTMSPLSSRYAKYGTGQLGCPSQFDAAINSAVPVVNCRTTDRMPHCGHKPPQNLSHLIAGTAARKCIEWIRSTWRKVKWRKAL